VEIQALIQASIMPVIVAAGATIRSRESGGRSMTTGYSRAGGSTTGMNEELGFSCMVTAVADKKEQTTAEADSNWSSSTTIKAVKIYNEAARV